MHTFRHILVCVGGIAILALAAGCEQKQQTVKAAPGALPSPTLDTGPDPKISASTFFAHGHLLERQGSYDKAIENYRRALEMQPDFITASNRLAVTYNKMGRHADATRELQAAVARKPDQAYLFNNLGFSLFLEGRYAEAEQAYARALTLKPEFVRAKMNRAVALGKLGRFDEAYQMFTAICSPSDALFNMGILLTEASRYAEAAQYLEAALAANPENAAARAQLSEVARLAAMENRSRTDQTRVAGGATATATTTLSAFAAPAADDPQDGSVAILTARDPIESQPPALETPAATPPAESPTTAAPPAAAPPAPLPPTTEPEKPAAPPTTEPPAQVPPTPAPAPQPPAEPADGGVLEVPAVDVPARP